MATKRQQTMAKLTRERKLEKKKARKLAAAEGGEPMVEVDEFGVPIAEGDEPLETTTD